MTVKLTIDSAELRECARDLRHVGATVNEALADALDEFGDAAEQQYDRRLPPDVSGDTRDGIASEPAYVRSTVEVRKLIGNTHFVARFLEEGTVKMRPRPALDPAVRATMSSDLPAAITSRLRRMRPDRLRP